MGHTITHHQQCYQLVSNPAIRDSVLKLRSLQSAKITGAELGSTYSYYYSTLLSFREEKAKQLVVYLLHLDNSNAHIGTHCTSVNQR
jgi:hypothetical protein